MKVIIDNVKYISESEVDAIRKELEVTDKILNSYKRVLEAIPECEAHGNLCVPHAVEWVEKMKLNSLSLNSNDIPIPSRLMERENTESPNQKGNSNDTGKERGEEYWKGFEFACEVLESMGYDRQTNHPYLLSDCLRAKCNKIVGEIRENPHYQKFKIKWSTPSEQPTNDNAFVLDTEWLFDKLKNALVKEKQYEFGANVRQLEKDYIESKLPTPVEYKFEDNGDGTFIGPASLAEHPRCKKAEPLPTKQDKEWEIVSFSSIHGEVLTLDEKKWKYRSETSSISDIDFLIKHYSIHSVRRLSDNVVFQVGDKIGWGIHSDYESTLTGFEIKDGRLKFHDEKNPRPESPCDFINAVNLHKKLSK